MEEVLVVDVGEGGVGIFGREISDGLEERLALLAVVLVDAGTD